MNKDIDQSRSPQNSAPPKVLVVDDTPENIIALKKLLNKLDLTVTTANSGNEALAETLYNDFALIFLDVQMPEMDGYEVADILKSNEKTASIPIIFITAIDRDHTKELKGYDKGAVDFIFKPFNEFILLNKTKIFLDIHKMKSSLETLVSERTSALNESNLQLQREISRKEETERELIRTKSHLTSIINSMSSILVGTDAKGLIKDMNLTAVNFSGIDFSDAQGKSIHEVLPLFSETVRELLERSTSNGPVEKTKIPISVDGVESVFNFALYPLIGEDFDQVVIRVDDVTKAQQMEEEIEKRRHIDSLGQLAGGVAHDFNNMLSAIMGAAEMLRLKAGGNPSLAKYIDGIISSVEHAANLTNKLLRFAKKKAGGEETVDVHSLIKDTVLILQRSIDKRIEIVVKTDAAQSMVQGDNSELSNALLNIGINARDAMPNGGLLTITTKNRLINDSHTASTLELSKGQYLELSVADTGTGMSDEVRNKAFEPFFSTKEPGKGTGLGLASVYGTIKSHSGTIRLESSPGKGTTFTLLLPTSTKVAKHPRPTPHPDLEEKIQGTVLLVDDEENVRTIGSALLVELGLEVLTAKNGRQAVDIVQAQQDKISLIILDMIMPELNGHDCFQEIKKIMPDARVLICSGYAPDETVAKLLREGVLALIKKPFRFAELKEVVHTYL
ncbi:ATP-binding response regulator [Desulfogranum mediterraneum]|uniref:ATP-binding response regulator n=1 Tax=Desulfogranum mediterraneum TaxID=160661 RepID=UPI000421FDB6|nr:response regulator [Desulfogranum mediterraneum]